MTTRISDLHIARKAMLPSPLTLREELPLSEAQAAHMKSVLLESHPVAGRQDTVAVLDGLADAVRSRAARTR